MSFILVDWEEARKMAEAGASGSQIAAHFGMHKNTFYERCREELGVTCMEWLGRCRAKGDALLHVCQYRRAVGKKPSDTMLIWLGKQRLKQRDNPDEEQTKANATADAIKGLSELTNTLTPDIVAALSELSAEEQLKLVQTVIREGKRKPKGDDVVTE